MIKAFCPAGGAAALPDGWGGCAQSRAVTVEKAAFVPKAAARQAQAAV